MSTALIADAYPHGRRSFALAVFNLAVPVGSALGYVLGGIVAELWGWRAAFLIVGTPGIALAGLFLLLREPPRSAPAPHGIERGSVSALLRDPVFVLTTLGMAALTFVLGALAAWMPTFLVRVHGLSMSRAAITFGLVTAATGVVGTALGGWLGDRAARSHPAGPLRVSGFGLLAAVPFAWAAVAADEPFVFWTATAVAETLVFLNTGPLSAVVASAAASEIRASAVAWNILAIHLLGDALSPWLVGALSDAVGLRAALGVMPPMLLASGLLCLAAGRRLRAAAG